MSDKKRTHVFFAVLYIIVFVLTLYFNLTLTHPLGLVIFILVSACIHRIALLMAEVTEELREDERIKRH